MIDIHKIFDFIKFTQLFQSIQRIILVPGTDRDENDAEHSYQLALLSWYVVESNNLKLDMGKVIKYCLAHDLVEAYAGDTFFYSKDKKERESKVEREAEAAARIKKKFPEFDELHKIIHSYEERSDEEARFVYALDKVIPILNIYIDGGRTWRRDNVTYKMLRDGKDSKIAVNEDVQRIWEAMTEFLDAEKDTLFPTENDN